MDKARIKTEAENFFEWPDPKRRDHVTLTSCLLFAEVIAGMSAAAERERCAKLCAGIGAGYTGKARLLNGQHATHAAGQRDGANECATEIRKQT